MTKKRNARGGSELVVPVLVGAGALAVVGAVVRAAVEHWPIVLAVAAASGVGVWLWWSRERERRALRAQRLAALRLTPEQIDGMTPAGFEDAVRDLFARDGFTARRVGGRGDQAADVLAEDPATSRRWMVQCKHTRTGARVGVRVLYEVNGTRDAHGAHEVVVVTNGGFTADARTWAKPRRIRLIDRESLHLWAASGRRITEVGAAP